MIVRIENDGGVQTLVTDGEGKPIPVVVSYTISQTPHELPKIDLHLRFVAFGLTGEARTFYKDRQIAKVVYSDGGEELF